MAKWCSIVCIVVLFGTSHLALVVFANDQVSVTCLTSPSPGSSCEEVQNRCESNRVRDCFPDSSTELKGYTNYIGDGSICNCDENAEQNDDECAASPNTDPATSIRLNALSAKLVSVSPKYYMVQTSWNLTNTSSNSSGGYELRLKNKNGDVVRCIRISDPTRLKFNLTNLSYNKGGDEHLMSVEVLPFPVGAHVAEGNIKLEKKFNKPSGCSEIEHAGTLCSSPAYGKPANFTVVSSNCSNDTKQLDIHWDHPSLGVGFYGPVLPPPTYYMLVYNKSKILIKLKIDNSTRVKLTFTDTSNFTYTNDVYSIRVKPYSYCSGLGSYSNIDRPKYGCGDTSSKVIETLVASTCVSPSPSPSPTLDDLGTTESFSSPPSSNDTDSKSPLADSLSAVAIAVPLLLVVIILVIIALVSLVYHSRRLKDPEVHDTELINSKVFVLYCGTTPEKELRYIQEHVVCRLLQYFEVSTPNDCNRGNVVKWLEEKVHMTPSVLLVCNQEFFSEWTKPEQHRSSIFNSLDLLISSAVSSNSVGKFGIVLVGDCKKEKCIPDHSYLKVMPVFVMGKDKWEKERIEQFVTHSKPFKFAVEESLAVDIPAALKHKNLDPFGCLV